MRARLISCSVLGRLLAVFLFCGDAGGLVICAFHAWRSHDMTEHTLGDERTFGGLEEQGGQGSLRASSL